MNDNMKKILLQRKFSSVEYIEEMQGYFQAALEALNEALSWVEQNVPDSERRNWHRSDWPETWRARAQRNLNDIDRSITQGLRQYASGDPDRIVGTCNNVMSLGKDLDNMGEKWWAYVPQDYQQRFDENLSQAIRRASRIAWTLAGAWKDAELLNERITGPVDEQDLLQYLKPGEQP